MDFAEALSQLADIHNPQPVGWWPLAPGWWVLIVLLAALALYGLWRLMLRMQRARRLKQAEQALNEYHQQLQSAGSDDMQQRLLYVNNVNSVLRRVALAHFPHDQVAGLSGDAWVDFLRRHDSRGLLTPQLATALAQGRFAPRCDVDIDALHEMAAHWIKGMYMARIESSKQPTSTASAHHA